MRLDTILDLVVKQTANLGYRDDAVRRNYAYSDVWVTSGGTRSVPFVAFTQTPPSYRSAGFAIDAGSQDDAPKLVESHRALGAPLFFVYEGDTVSRWKVFAKQPPELLERFPIEHLAEVFYRNRSKWAPDAIHRAKSIGRVDPVYQLDFVDTGLIPAIEGEIHVKLDRLIQHAVSDVQNVHNPGAMRLLFRGVFRLLAAKILTDRRHNRASQWNVGSVADVLSSMGDYYRLGNEAQVWPSATLISLDRVWTTFLAGFNVANISADDLAFVYESTLVTQKARAEFSTHSTPRHVADYILDRFRLWEFGSTPPKVYEPFAGAGVFLGSALRQMRDGLPHSWSDRERHNLLIRHIGGAEIDPFACEVAKLSLILADYPNANGWRIEETDLFKKGVLANRLEGADIILCNPPFEAFLPRERKTYREASKIDGSKAVFALETALWARPQMLGFVVPNTLLVDRRYRESRRSIEKLYREIEFVALPDGVFNVSQVDTALLIAREHRQVGEEQRIRSSAVFDAHKRRFIADRKASRTTEEVRQWGTSRDGSIWVPPLSHVWLALADRPTLGALVSGHWGLRWHGGQKNISRVSDQPKPGWLPGYIDSSALHQFVLGSPRFLDARRRTILAGGNYAWDAPKILCNAGRLSRGYWRLAAAFDRGGNLASQQFIAFWPTETAPVEIDLDAIVAILNGPIVNAFLTEHSFDKRFRIRMLERAPLPAQIPKGLGDLSRAYATAARQRTIDSSELATLLRQIDSVVLESYELPDELKRDVLASFGESERPVVGFTRRRSRVKSKPGSQPLPLFPNLGNVEEDIGQKLGDPLSPLEAETQLRSIATPLPIEVWAGLALPASEVVAWASINPVLLADLTDQRRIISFKDEQDTLVYPVEQFINGEPIAGLDEILTTIGDPRVAWLWLRQPHASFNDQRPLDLLRDGKIDNVRSIAMRNFR